MSYSQFPVVLTDHTGRQQAATLTIHGEPLRLLVEPIGLHVSPETIDQVQARAGREFG